jgi:virulence-associated protein VapD
MRWLNFSECQVGLTEKSDMANLFRAIEALKKIEWFKNSVRDIRAFRVED